MNRETPDTEIRNSALHYALQDQKQRLDKLDIESTLSIDNLISTAERFRCFLTPPQPSTAGNTHDTQPSQADDYPTDTGL